MEDGIFKKYCSWRDSGDSFWGWFFVVFGGYFLLKELNIIPENFPLWQIFLIAFGVYLISNKWRHG